jgi:hypothetical protein
MNPPKRSKIGQILFSIILLLIAGGVIFKQQEILDWWTLRNYQVPVAVSNIANDTTMSSYGRKLFYVNKPQLQNKAAFYKSCEEGETTVVLGCYKPKQGIFILDVDDERLDGIEQVTAAHEMLHVAYDRLDSTEKQEIGSKLTSFYATLNDEQLQSKIKIYEKSGADIANELHSILGTEQQTLNPELELYYKQFFNDRKSVVAFSQKYQAVFNERKNKLKQLDAQLAEIEEKVKANNVELDRQQATINAEARRLDLLLQQNKIDEYNSGVIAYNKTIAPFKALVAETKQLIAEYKTILEERNRVAAEAQELNKALDSRIIEQPETNTTL